MPLRGYAKSAECQCERSFTCGYCCRNMKPWLFTPRTSQQILHDAIWANYKGESPRPPGDTTSSQTQQGPL